MRTVVPIDPPDDPMIEDALALGAAVRAARTTARLPLVEAADALGMSRQTLINIETGQGGVSLSTVLKAARALGVSLFAVPSQQREVVRRAIRTARDSKFSDLDDDA
ncbi:helix-turn-helix transcriptional regulator [Mitsuaria sp. 7]|uniref:helix-turn-helix transcriptional regulator n=1 Tax=Mitsuaria sp. 7 TaxID=1658665 RepID=UPI0009ED41E4|nr:helix-turn-helix transcriptional regulator [Mitsuaria sp. 7]